MQDLPNETQAIPEDDPLQLTGKQRLKYMRRFANLERVLGRITPPRPPKEKSEHMKEFLKKYGGKSRKK